MNKILLVPHPKLRQKAEEILEVTNTEIDIAKKMMELVQSAPGVGLAANQIGILKKIITINIEDKTKSKNIAYSLFNPKIISYSKELILMEEGCLSFPEQYAEIERPSSVKIEYINEKNEIIKAEKKGFEARVIQHEIDHLQGKLFIDYLSSLRRNIILNKIKKLKKMSQK
tara:strand:+ start:537 stop:1049 length:513 start_codon:yes stop_codon:yes gene_type:complete